MLVQLSSMIVCTICCFFGRPRPHLRLPCDIMTRSCSELRAAVAHTDMFLDHTMFLPSPLQTWILRRGMPVRRRHLHSICRFCSTLPFPWPAAARLEQIPCPLFSVSARPCPAALLLPCRVPVSFTALVVAVAVIAVAVGRGRCAAAHGTCTYDLACLSRPRFSRLRKKVKYPSAGPST